MKRRYVLCVSNEGYEISLEPRKVYEVIPDDWAEEHGMVRVIDETEEDYLFEQSRFVPIEVPAEAQAIFAAAPV